MKDEKHYILFRAVPTMKCNYRCQYCFVPNQEKATQATMFDEHSPEEWIEAMEHYSEYDVEFYFWGGEPFVINGTYQVIKGWTELGHVIDGSRIDTNTAFTDKIAERCPTEKLKLNCSWHTQYDSLNEIYSKVKRLKDLDMVGMTNFVASDFNMKVLKNDYDITVEDLIKRFEDIDVYLNIAADFSLVNNRPVEQYSEYKEMILRYLNPEDWRQLRCEKGAAYCDANQHYFTIHPNGDITPCLGEKVVGNFFKGTLDLQESAICHKRCPSLVSYGFRRDNDFNYRRHVVEYAKRNTEYRTDRDAQNTVYSHINSPSEAMMKRGDESSLVSVVLPTYNDMSHLSRMIESVLNQTYENFELIIVNDGSTDGTGEYLDTMNDERIRVIHQENRKLPGALNSGFEKAKGEYLTWVSSDNYCAPFFIEGLVGALKKYPECGLAYSDFYFIDDGDRILSRVTWPDMSYRSLLARNQGNASFLYTREVMEKIGSYDTEIVGAEDWDYWIRTAEHFEIVYVPDALYYYRLHGKSMQSTMKEEVNEAVGKTIDNAMKRVGGQIDLSRLYPEVVNCYNREEANFLATFDFGTSLIRSRVRIQGLGEQLLRMALQSNPNFVPAKIHLALELAYSGQWDKASLLAESISLENNQFQLIVQQLRKTCQNQSYDDLNTIPLINLDKATTELFKRESEKRKIFAFAAL